jgi:hypothetical protein
MNFRTAITTWAGAGAAENARRSLDEWSRAQDEVSASLLRLEQRAAARSAASPASGEPAA